MLASKKIQKSQSKARLKCFEFPFVAAIVLLAGLTSPAWAQDSVDLSKLDGQARKQVEAACYFHKLEGASVYTECLKRRIAKLDTSVAGISAPTADNSSDLPTLSWKDSGLGTSASWGGKQSASSIFKLVEQSVYIILAAATREGLEALRDVSQGSAVAISETMVLTNCHVVEDAPEIVLVATDGYLPAKLRTPDISKDSCVLEVAGGLKPIPSLRRYDSLEVGERVYTVGSPSGLQNTLSEGVVSGLRVDEDVRYVQTTAPISPGSSGGGLFDTAGNLVGITTFLLEDAQNLNFAIAVEEFWK
ncbi:MAG: S1C family serine protease [Alphaproteobacteria bacterium]|nr:S1C family serine protease [Alphaproteobacteria bacterium]